MTEKNYITILGLGNILLQDEGRGVHFIRWFENNRHVPEEELPDVFFLCIVPL
jgi:Ni,Fe-hydrogenase maturation factor